MSNTRSPRIVLAALISAGAVAMFVVARNWSAEPTYDGKTVAEWFKLYRSSSIAEQEDARDAFKAMGDQAAPFLLSILTRTFGMSLARGYEKFWAYLPSPLRRVLPRVSNEETANRAASALLETIRPSSKVLTPRLMPWIGKEMDRATRRHEEAQKEFAFLCLLVPLCGHPKVVPAYPNSSAK